MRLQFFVVFNNSSLLRLVFELSLQKCTLTLSYFNLHAIKNTWNKREGVYWNMEYKKYSEKLTYWWIKDFWSDMKKMSFSRFGNFGVKFFIWYLKGTTFLCNHYLVLDIFWYQCSKWEKSIPFSNLVSSPTDFDRFWRFWNSN